MTSPFKVIMPDEALSPFEKVLPFFQPSENCRGSLADIWTLLTSLLREEL